jgi:protein phosphatase
MQVTRELKIESEITASVQTDTGCVRDANEDAGRHIAPADPDILLRRGTLTIVADGMGGHSSGEIASAMAIEIVSEIYYAEMDLPAAEALETAIQTANAAIFQKSLTDETYFGMGTTVVALAVFGDTALTAHVGDSRVYRLRDGRMKMLTLDHSHVMEMVAHGIISMDEARNHDDKNVILRAVGTQEKIVVEVSEPFAVEPFDEFLLCSDGLSDMLADDEIAAIWASRRDLYTACERLIAEAKTAGGHDNITAGIVRVAPRVATPKKVAVRATREIEIA